jgi:hypothetical protein
MNHSRFILSTLDQHLSKPTTLILYGRAALALGFDPALPAAFLSRDVDVILPEAQSQALDNDPEFWSALEAANAGLEASGLYMTHLFDEHQVILRPEWLEHLVAIPAPELRHITLYRPHDLDLLLTKMMRGPDPQDMADADFIIQSAKLTQAEIKQAIKSARLPDIPELQTLFDEAVSVVLALLKST